MCFFKIFVSSQLLQFPSTDQPTNRPTKKLVNCAKTPDTTKQCTTFNHYFSTIEYIVVGANTQKFSSTGYFKEHSPAHPTSTRHCWLPEMLSLVAYHMHVE